ncbi:LysR family transcriptional regulator [Pokkaliibacter sp. CJK22405]|uniref:LysR family transcriptional regulator n=1 Tax=Pokkaliibacter sp. CJK22405 TaxID=3384615 RepID=UPI003984AF6C
MGNTFDTQVLHAFIAVAESRSFSQAAERLFLTQPAISKRIAGLEEQLGKRLFDRVGRQIQLTEAGKLLLARSYLLFDMMEDTRRALDNLDGEIAGTLTFATSHHIGLHRLPPVLETFAHQYPNVRLDIRFGESEKAYEGVLKGEFELAIITLAPDPDPRLESISIWDDELRFVCSQHHPLAQAEALTLQQLAEYEAILPDQRTFTRQRLEELLKEHELRLKLGMTTNNLDTIRMLVQIGQGWSLLPSKLSEGLCLLPLLDKPIDRPLGYIRHRERTLSNAAEAFMQTLRDHTNETTAE